MTAHEWIVSTPFAKEHFGQGRAEGRAEGLAEGRAETLIAVLQGRGLRVTAAQRERIAGCTDLDQFHQWASGAAVARTTGALLRGEPLPAAARGGSRQQRSRAGQPPRQ